MKKFLLGAGVVAAVSVGSVVFTGGDIIDQVNTKVAGMFEMISQYESNENKLVDTINHLKSTKNRLENQVQELITNNNNKDVQISDLNTQITGLNRQIEILEQQLDNKNGLAQEITRLENEVNKANTKVAELQTILDTQINDAPLTEEEINELQPFDGTIYVSSESADEAVIQLSSYAELHIKRFSEDEFLGRIKSTTDDAFTVELGYGDSSSVDLCKPGSDVIFKIFLGNSYNCTYIKINEGEFTYKFIVE